MADFPNVSDECSQAWRALIDNIDEWGLLGYQTNQMEADPIDEEAVEGDTVRVEDNVEEFESDILYVGMSF